MNLLRALLALSLLLFAAIVPVRAAEPVTVADLFEQTVALAGYKEMCDARGGCEPPAVVLAPFDNTDIAGRFDPRKASFVQINPILPVGSLRWNSTVVHEFTHYLQWLFGALTPAVACADVQALEFAAYDAAAAYLAQHDITADYTSQRFRVTIMCSQL